MFSSEAHLAALQPTLGFAFAPPIAVFAAPTFNVLVAHKGEIGIDPSWSTSLSSGSTAVRAWPGATLGLRANL